MAKGTFHIHQASRKNGKNLQTTHVTIVTATKADIPGTGTEEPEGILILGQTCLSSHSLSIWRILCTPLPSQEHWATVEVSARLYLLLLWVFFFGLLFQCFFTL